MLKKTFIAISIIIWAVGSTSYANDPQLSMDKIVENMGLAIDPENNKQHIKTLITVAELSIPSQEIKMQITITDKFPDKTKTVRKIPGVMSVTRILNASQGWETNSLGAFREIKGKELELMKFELFMKTPAVSMKQAFKEIKVENRNAMLGDNLCYILSCIPAVDLDIPPIVMYVNKDNFLTEKIEMKAETPQGSVGMTILIEEYKKINGRKVPVKTKILQGGVVMIKKLISVKENIKIDDSEFENPSPVEVFK